jgi:uncharacterized protein (TIGR02118 family)
VFKMTIVVWRNPAVTLEEAHRWWIEEHAPIVRRTPGLRGYVINLAQPGDGTDPELMGTDDITFDSREAFEAAWRSPEWQAAREHTAAAGHRAIRAVVKEVRIIDPDAGA